LSEIVISRAVYSLYGKFKGLFLSAVFVVDWRDRGNIECPSLRYRLERARESLEEADILLNPCWPFNRGGNVPHYYFKSILLIALKI